MVVLDDTRADSLPQPPDAYWARRADITSRAAGVDAPPVDIDYTAAEHEVWRIVAAALDAAWAYHAATDVLAARDALALPTDRVPQLSEVDHTLRPLTGFGYRGVEGLIPSADFFAALANRTFPSTQYLRWEGAPLYTPEPDVIHEVMGHGNCLACPQIAELHRLAGAAIGRIETELARQWVGDVFWFTVEFGVLGDTAPDSRRRRTAPGCSAHPASSAGSPNTPSCDRSTSSTWRPSASTSTTTSRCCSPGSRWITCSTWSEGSSTRSPTTAPNARCLNAPTRTGSRRPTRRGRRR